MTDQRAEDRYRTRTTLALYHALRGIVLLTALFFMASGTWMTGMSTLGVFFLTLVPEILRRRGTYLPFALDLGIVFYLFFTLFLGQMIDLYSLVTYWDKASHFQSGLLLGGVGFVLVYGLNERGRRHLSLSPEFVALFAVAFSLSLGAMWEIAEFIWDQALTRSSQASLNDTMWDLIADLSGALIASCAGYFWMYRHARLPLTPGILRSLWKRKLGRTPRTP